MGAVELATGFIDLVPSARGIAAGLNKELGAPLQAAAAKSGDQISKSLGAKLTSVANRVTAGLSAGAVGIAGLAIKNGDALNEAQDQLANAAEKVGVNVSVAAAAVAKAVPHFEAYGITQDQITQATTGFLRIGDSVPKALADAQHAADLASVAHIGYADASKLVIQADEGKFRGIQKFLGPIKNATQLQSAWGRVQGAAAVASQSLTGKTDALHAKFTDLTGQLGQKLIPILLQVLTKFGDAVNFFEHNRVALDLLITAVGLFVAAMVTLSIIDTVRKATEAWTVVQGVLNAVMLANPIVGVIAVIALLVAGVIYAYNHFAFFHNAVQQAWNILQSVFGWVKAHWPLLLAILTGPIGLAVLFIVTHFQSIVSTVQGVVTKVITFFRNLPGSILKVLTGYNRLLFGFGEDLIHGIASGITSAAGALIGAIKSIIDKIPGHGLISKGLSLVGIKGFAEGGVVPGPAGAPQFAIVHGGERILTARQQQSGYLDGHSSARGARGGPFIGGDVNIVAPDPRSAVQELSWMYYTAS